MKDALTALLGFGLPALFLFSFAALLWYIRRRRHVERRMLMNSHHTRYLVLLLALLTASVARPAAQVSSAQSTPAVASASPVRATASVSQQPSNAVTTTFGGSLGDIAEYSVIVVNYGQTRWTGSELAVAQQVSLAAGINVVSIPQQQNAISAAQGKSLTNKLLLACQGIGFVESGVTLAKAPNLPKSYPAIGASVAAICTALTPWANAKSAAQLKAAQQATQDLLSDEQITIAPAAAYTFTFLGSKKAGFVPVHVVVE